jgi:four helix bundle protein
MKDTENRNPLKIKSYAFALRIVKLCQYLKKEKDEYILSRQVLRSGTAIGALISEAKFGQSKADFVSKMSIGLKEAIETDYWLCLLKDGGYIDENLYKSLAFDLNEIISMLVSTVKTAKNGN